MATQHPDQSQPVDTIEEDINLFFNRIVACVDYRREALLAKAKEKREEKRAKLERKEQSEKQLLATKAEIERNLKDNLFQETQEEFLAKLEEKLAEVRLTLPETRLIFQGDSEQLEQLILCLGEVSAVVEYKGIRSPVLSVGGGESDEEGLFNCPRGVAVEYKTGNIYVADNGNDRVQVFDSNGK